MLILVSSIIISFTFNDRFNGENGAAAADCITDGIYQESLVL